VQQNKRYGITGRNLLRTVLVVLALGSYAMPALANDWERVLALDGQWKFSIGDNLNWAAQYYNDKEWEDIRVPRTWEDEGFNGYDGYAWYRKTFSGTALKDQNINYNLFLGYVDDVDEVYFNGHKIGYSGTFPPKFRTAFNAMRNYYIPREYINFAGNNVIAVRVYDSESVGGITSGDVGIYVNKEDKGLTINLRGVWKLQIAPGIRYQNETCFGEHDVQKIGASNTAEAWADINVPAAWEHQGFNNYDGGAWYRKQFVVPKSMRDEDLVLLLGKIDDSDRVFLNGKPVGNTRMGAGRLRIYYIPAKLVKVGELNMLLVFVEDTGGTGGIMYGPVGIVKQSAFTKYIRNK
jgi:hypothetical protein